MGLFSRNHEDEQADHAAELEAERAAAELAEKRKRAASLPLTTTGVESGEQTISLVTGKRWDIDDAMRDLQVAALDLQATAVRDVRIVTPVSSQYGFSSVIAYGTAVKTTS